jgi:hypothetical protein
VHQAGTIITQLATKISIDRAPDTIGIPREPDHRRHGELRGTGEGNPAADPFDWLVTDLATLPPYTGNPVTWSSIRRLWQIRLRVNCEHESAPGTLYVAEVQSSPDQLGAADFTISPAAALQNDHARQRLSAAAAQSVVGLGDRRATPPQRLREQHRLHHSADT